MESQSASQSQSAPSASAPTPIHQEIYKALQKVEARNLDLTIQARELCTQLVYKESRIASLNRRVDELHDLVEEKEARIVALESRCVVPPYSRTAPATEAIRALQQGRISVAELGEWLTDYFLHGEQRPMSGIAQPPADPDPQQEAQEAQEAQQETQPEAQQTAERLQEVVALRQRQEQIQRKSRTAKGAARTARWRKKKAPDLLEGSRLEGSGSPAPIPIDVRRVKKAERREPERGEQDEELNKA